nr:immunoglobulin heavy chain junction region [Mus musculus]
HISVQETTVVATL